MVFSPSRYFERNYLPFSGEIGDKPMCSESLILIACLFCAPVAVLDPVLKALWNLDRMSICKLGYPASVYNNYGCWCGVGGSGKPMDGIDSTTSVTTKQLAKAIAMTRLRNISFPIIGSAFKISPKFKMWLCHMRLRQRNNQVLESF
ncbi:Phospholipase A(2) [Dirofilaria immitis]|nr:Phospholipase A(2) [Dirofilaria immitis]